MRRATLQDTIDSINNDSLHYTAKMVKAFQDDISRKLMGDIMKDLESEAVGHEWDKLDMHDKKVLRGIMTGIGASVVFQTAQSFYETK